MMKELVYFETDKLLHRPVALISLICMILFTTYTLFMIIPVKTIVREEIDGELVVTSGLAAVKRNKEIIAPYEGAWTTEKVREIIDTYAFSASAMEKAQRNPTSQKGYTHNFLYDSLYTFINDDGSYNGFTVERVYDWLPDLTLGYSAGWQSMISAMTYGFTAWAFCLIIILSPVFCNEYSRHMDALILSGRQGKTKCITAKIISSYLISLGGSLILLTVYLLCLFITHGFTGARTSVQLGDMIFSFTYYALTWGQAFAFAVLLELTAITVVTAIILTVSALAHNRLSSLAIILAIFFMSKSIAWLRSHHRFVQLMGALMPIQQIQLADLFVLSYPTGIPENNFNKMWLSIPIAIAAFVIGIVCPKHFFARHQVK